MATARRRSGFAFRHPVVVDVGCSCRRPRKLSSLFSSFSLISGHSKPKRTSASSSSPSTTTATTTTAATAASAASTWDASFTTTNSLYEAEEEEYRYRYCQSPHRPILNEGRRPPVDNGGGGRRRRRGGRRGRRKEGQQGRVERESVAVAVETEEPYEDFKESMVRMVVENEIYAWDDLNDLLHRFLSLNSPRHHSLILRAFADLWTGLFSPPSPCL